MYYNLKKITMKLISSKAIVITIFCRLGQQGEYLSGHFTFGNSELETHVEAGGYTNMRLPLAIAAVAGATNSIKALLEAGVCPKQVDCHGNNVVHSMIAFLHYHNDMEDAIISKFQILVDTVCVDFMKVILHHENSYGLRPIEFAAQHGQGSMVLAIMNTPGVYLTKQEQCGLTCYKWYNITEYESTGNKSRGNKSPLRILTCADKDTVDNGTLNNVLQGNVLKSWLGKKFSVNLPLLLLWFLMRLCFIIGYMAIDLDSSSETGVANSTHCIPEYAILIPRHVLLPLGISVMALAAFSLIIDITDLVRSYKSCEKYLWSTISGKKDLMLQYGLYRGSHFVFCLIIVTFIPFIYIEKSDNMSLALGIARIISPFCAIWSGLFFLQLVPSIGLLICTIYRMMSDLVKLTIVYWAMILPFVQSFYNFVNGNTLEGCIKGFDTMFGTFYRVFLMMLNMVDLTEMELQNTELLYLTHMVYTFVVSIMLINFFIAVMADSVSTLATRKKVAVDMQRAGVSFAIEYRLKWLIKAYYNSMTRRYFTCEKDEVFLVEAQSLVSEGKCSISDQPELDDNIHL